MRVLSTLGLFLALAGLAIASMDVVHAFETGIFDLTAIGDIWYDIHAGSLNLVQAMIERYLWPPLWDPLMTTILLWPAGFTYLIVGLLMFFGAKSRV